VQHDLAVLGVVDAAGAERELLGGRAVERVVLVAVVDDRDLDAVDSRR
jgi:hypothetical protein